MLTDAQCRNAKCPPDKKQARFSDSGGMYLQVSPAGSKRWFLKYRVAGVEKRVALGSYPDVSLTAARKARDAAKLIKSDGRDPVQVRKIEKLKATRTDGDTFKAVALEWYATNRHPNGAKPTLTAASASLSATCSRGLASGACCRFIRWSCWPRCTRLKNVGRWRLPTGC